MTAGRFPDRLSLLGMRFRARHGVQPHEKETDQPFEVDVVLHADLSRAAETDALGETVDYAALRDAVTAVVRGPSFDLIEALAAEIARATLAATDPALVDSVEVRVRKPEALAGDLDGPEVSLLRGRPTG